MNEKATGLELQKSIYKVAFDFLSLHFFTIVYCFIISAAIPAVFPQLTQVAYIAALVLYVLLNYTVGYDFGVSDKLLYENYGVKRNIWRGLYACGLFSAIGFLLSLILFLTNDGFIYILYRIYNVNFILLMGKLAELKGIYFFIPSIIVFLFTFGTYVFGLYFGKERKRNKKNED